MSSNEILGRGMIVLLLPVRTAMLPCISFLVPCIEVKRDKRAHVAAAAWLVFEKVGVGLLRKAWFNLDVIWACALIATGVLTFTL
jgi:hypothetical protein